MMAMFWWGNKSKENEIHWLSWGKLKNSKVVVVWVIGVLKRFNDAILGK